MAGSEFLPEISWTYRSTSAILSSLGEHRHGLPGLHGALVGPGIGVKEVSSLGKTGSEESNKEYPETESARAVHAGQPPARIGRSYREQIEARDERRRRLLKQDALGRTPLFYAAEQGLEEEVWEMIFSFRGTGMFPPRLQLISTRDHSGLTAADVAEQNGHEGIARLLHSEQGRMEFFE